MAKYPTFPDLSRQPALKTKTSTADPTIRDTQDNGMVATRPRFTAARRTWTVTIEFLPNEDVRRLEQFVTTTVAYGAGMFYFIDTRDPTLPTDTLVRFSKIPDYTDAGWVGDELRQNATFELQEA